MPYYTRFGKRNYYAANRGVVLTPHHTNSRMYMPYDTLVQGPMINYPAWQRNVAAQRAAQMRYNIINAGMRRFNAPPEIGRHVMSFLPQGQVMAPYKRTYFPPMRRRRILTTEERTMNQLIRDATQRIRAGLPTPPQAQKMDEQNVDENDVVEPSNKRQYTEDTEYTADEVTQAF